MSQSYLQLWSHKEATFVTLTAPWTDTDSYACCFTTTHSHLSSRGGTLAFSPLDVLTGDTAPLVREALNEGLLDEGSNKVSNAALTAAEAHAEGGRTLSDCHL